MYYVDLSMHISIVWIKERNKKTKELNPQALPAAAVDDPSVSVIFSAPLRID